MRLSGVPEIEVLEPPSLAGWPGFVLKTGADDSGGMWKHPRRWALWVRILWADGLSEHREHVVLAGSRAAALDGLKRDLRAQEDGWQIRLVQVCRIEAPRTAAELHEIGQANLWLTAQPRPAWLAAEIAEREKLRQVG